MLAAALVLALVAGLFGTAIAQGKKPAGKAPKAIVGEMTFLVGDILEGTDVVHSFRIKNAGDAELQILSVRPG